MTRALPRDPALPQLALALDGDAMAWVFGTSLHGVQVRGCEVERVKYRPRRSCTLAYRLTLRDGRGRDIVQRAAARLCTGGESERRHGAAMGRATLPSAVGPAVLHLRQLDMLVHWAPNDAKLDALGLLDDGAALPAAALDPVVAALAGAGGRGRVRRTTLVQYVPEHRASARVELDVERADGTTGTEVLYAKADADRRGGTTHAVMKMLHDSVAQGCGLLRTPESLLWHAASGLHWQRALPGRVLGDVDPAVGTATSERVGTHLAALHGTPVPVAARIAYEALRAQPRDAARWLAEVEPAWTAVLARLARRLEDGGARLEREPSATLHGDLHARNILVGVDGLAFIDLDGVRRGAPVLELGAWVADALYRARLDGRDAVQAAHACRSFLAAHADASGHAPDERLLAWATAHSLLCTRAYRGVANLKPGRYEAVPALLALADDIAAAGTIDAAWAGVPEAFA